MNISKANITFGNDNIVIYYPENDSVVPGTLAGLQKGTWHLNNIPFINNDIFIDIGCSVGIISMVAAKAFPNIKIMAFDPNPVAIALFTKSLKENNIQNVNVFQVGVGVKNRNNVEFLTYSENESCLIQKELCTNERLKSYFSNIVSMDAIFDSYVNKVKYLKMDIETGEFAIFDHLFTNRLDILDRIEYLHVEIHPLTGEKRSEELKAKLEEKYKEKVFFY